MFTLSRMCPAPPTHGAGRIPREPLVLVLVLGFCLPFDPHGRGRRALPAQPFQLVPSLKDMSVQLLEAERERTDRDLVAGFLAGGELEFRTLYRRHTPRIRAVAMRFMGGEAADADDVVQETWLRACRAL